MGPLLFISKRHTFSVALCCNCSREIVLALIGVLTTADMQRGRQLLRRNAVIRLLIHGTANKSLSKEGEDRHALPRWRDHTSQLLIGCRGQSICRQDVGLVPRWDRLWAAAAFWRRRPRRICKSTFFFPFLFEAYLHPGGRAHPTFNLLFRVTLDIEQGSPTGTQHS